jgi:hypothetical protein
MTYTYAVQVMDSNGTRRRFEHTQDKRLSVGDAIEDHEQDATYIVVSIAESAARKVTEVEAVFSFAGTWPEGSFELHSFSVGH